MKIFSIKRVLGLAALYGAAQYAKKNGGFQNAFNGLLEKVRTAANAKKDEVIGSAHEASSVGSRTSFADENTGYGSGSYGGYSSGGFGGGNKNRH